MKIFLFSLLFVFATVLSNCFLYSSTDDRYYPLAIGDSWEYFLGDTVNKTILKFTIVSVDTINDKPFVKTKQEWFKGDSLTHTQEYFQTVDNGFVITAVNKKFPQFQIQHPCDGSVKFSEELAKKYSILLSEDQTEHLKSFRAAFTFIDFESGTHSMWEFRNKKEICKFAENVGLIYLKNENVQLTLKVATIKSKTYKLLQ